jgi:FMN phosphatase YigB (HAD superfamily)
MLYPSETIMIGDSYESDIIGARNAGIDQIYFEPIQNHSITDNPSTCRVKSLKDIMDIL